MLPSGRHIAVDPEPLRTLLLDLANPFNAHKIMAIRCVDDFFPWLDVLELVPEVEATREQRMRVSTFLDGLPEGLLPLRTGRHLADWRALAHDWTEDDRKAMAAFIADRVRPHYTSSLEEVRKRQEMLLASAPSLTGVLAHMWKAGYHPLTDEPAIDQPLPPQGVYARFAALLYAWRLFAAHPALTAEHRNTADRVSCFVTMCESKFAWPDPLPDESVGEYALRLHALDPLGELGPEQRAWFAPQTGSECETLWEAAGEALKSIDRATYDIVELAVLSGAAHGAR